MKFFFHILKVAEEWVGSGVGSGSGAGSISQRYGSESAQKCHGSLTLL